MLVIRNLWKNTEKHLKRRLKAKTISVSNSDYKKLESQMAFKIIKKEHIVLSLKTITNVINKGEINRG